MNSSDIVLLLGGACVAAAAILVGRAMSAGFGRRWDRSKVWGTIAAGVATIALGLAILPRFAGRTAGGLVPPLLLLAALLAVLLYLRIRGGRHRDPSRPSRS